MKEIANRKYYVADLGNYKRYTLELTMTDDQKVYLFVYPNDMIYVADCNWTELSARINADDTESFDCYDMIDGCPYYDRTYSDLGSAYDAEINRLLAYINCWPTMFEIEA